MRLTTSSALDWLMELILARIPTRPDPVQTRVQPPGDLNICVHHQYHRDRARSLQGDSVSDPPGVGQREQELRTPACLGLDWCLAILPSSIHDSDR